MTQQESALITFYKKGWENHQLALVKTIAPLTPEQLALPIAPHHWSVGQLLAHMINARVFWFHGWMGEGTADLVHWDDDEQARYEAASLVSIFEKTWRVIADAMTHWTSADLEQVFSPPASHQAWLQSQGQEEEPAHARQWIVWHVLEHEIHHGGEFSLALGTYGLESFYTW